MCTVLSKFLTLLLFSTLQTIGGYIRRSPINDYDEPPLTVKLQGLNCKTNSGCYDKAPLNSLLPEEQCELKGPDRTQRVVATIKHHREPCSDPSGSSRGAGSDTVLRRSHRGGELVALNCLDKTVAWWLR